MRKLHEIMFPSLAGKWEEVNLNELAKQHVVPGGDNPLLDPALQAGFLNAYHESRGVDYTFGGYLEDRSTLWQGHYHDPHKMTHLGIDYNVPANTPVCMPFNGRLVHKFLDPDQEGGWGGRATFYNSQYDLYFIIGHLDKLVEELTEDVWFGRGVHVGYVGGSEMNGGWFPHIHLQCVEKERMLFANGDFMSIDGYGGLVDPEGKPLGQGTNRHLLQSMYPNPELVAKED